GNAVGSLSEIASDDDAAGYLNSSLTFFASQNTAYHIAVDGRSGATGDVVLNWETSITTNIVPRFVTAPVSQSVFLGAPVVLSAAVDRAPATNSARLFQNGR